MRSDKALGPTAGRRAPTPTCARRPHQNPDARLPPLQSQCVSLPQWAQPYL